MNGFVMKWPLRAASLLFIAAGAALLVTVSEKIPAAQSLTAYNVDIKETSVSGLSSGAFFATQMQIAFASNIKGAGIIAGGPYDCAGQMSYTGCMFSSAPPVATSIARTNSWSGSRNDNKSNLTNQKLYMFSGTADSTVSQSVMDQLYRYYVTDGHFINAANANYKKDLNTGHTFPTDFDSPGNIACASTGNPWISNCGFDAAGAILQQIYGPLSPRNNGAPNGQLIEFDQAEFIANPRSVGLDDTGWIYVPTNCTNGASCKLHVAFHGCQQYFENIGDKFLKQTGYTRWADTNNLIILFPQTVADNTVHATAASFSLSNPNGCWDWIGWYGNDFDVKTGKQMAAVKKMIDRVASGQVAVAAPSGLAVTGTTNNSAALTWNAVSGVAGYNVYRNGSKVNGALVSVTNYTDNGLSSGTSYSYVVKSVTSANAESPPSSSVTATTTGIPPLIVPPANLTVSGKTDTTVTLAWNAANGAAGYNVYYATNAGGPWTKANTDPVTTTSYTVTNLSPSTPYFFVARSVAGGGAESADSNQVSATTEMAVECFLATNYSHVRAGRAHDEGGYALANGSNQNMGLDNIFYVRTLKRTGPNYYTIGTCP